MYSASAFLSCLEGRTRTDTCCFKIIDIQFAITHLQRQAKSKTRKEALLLLLRMPPVDLIQPHQHSLSSTETRRDIREAGVYRVRHVKLRSFQHDEIIVSCISCNTDGAHEKGLNASTQSFTTNASRAACPSSWPTVWGNTHIDCTS